jgi:hypothetical protein
MRRGGKGSGWWEGYRDICVYLHRVGGFSVGGWNVT